MYGVRKVPFTSLFSSVCTNFGLNLFYVSVVVDALIAIPQVLILLHRVLILIAIPRVLIQALEERRPEAETRELMWCT